MGLGAAALWLIVLGALAAPPHAAEASTTTQPAAGRTFTVTSLLDAPDLNPGDGSCDTGAGTHQCTLRAAVQEVDAGPGGDTILLQPTTYLLTQAGALNPLYDGNIDISRTVTILGGGP